MDTNLKTVIQQNNVKKAIILIEINPESTNKNEIACGGVKIKS